MEKDRFVSDKEAAEMLGLNRQTLCNWRHLQRGPAYSKLGRSVRYRLADLIAFAEAGKVEDAGQRAGR